MPHMKGESYTDYNTSYVYIYTDYLPVEFFCNGIISACLTFINVMCIFITAIIVLKVRKVGIVNPRQIPEMASRDCGNRAVQFSR